MNRRLLFLPFAALVALSGYMGWQMGQPLTETEILDFHAAQWVSDGPDGALETDCYGVPGQTPEVWMVVICQSGTVRRSTPVGRNGQALSTSSEPQA